MTDSLQTPAEIERAIRDEWSGLCGEMTLHVPDVDEPCWVIAWLLAALAERDERIKEAAFNCPSCGRHDFGLFHNSASLKRENDDLRHQLAAREANLNCAQDAFVTKCAELYTAEQKLAAHDALRPKSDPDVEDIRADERDDLEAIENDSSLLWAKGWHGASQIYVLIRAYDRIRDEVVRAHKALEQTGQENESLRAAHDACLTQVREESQEVETYTVEKRGDRWYVIDSAGERSDLASGDEYCSSNAVEIISTLQRREASHRRAMSIAQDTIAGLTPDAVRHADKIAELESKLRDRQAFENSIAQVREEMPEVEKLRKDTEYGIEGGLNAQIDLLKVIDTLEQNEAARRLLIAQLERDNDGLRTAYADQSKVLEQCQQDNAKWLNARDVWEVTRESQHKEIDELRAARDVWDAEKSREVETLSSQLAAMREALEGLVEDVRGYDAYDRPCYVLEKAENVLAAQSSANAGHSPKQRSDCNDCDGKGFITRMGCEPYECGCAAQPKQQEQQEQSPQPTEKLYAPQCGNKYNCANMKEVGGGMEGERYRCDVCDQGYFLDYEEMK